MWYLFWVIGTLLACSFAIITGLWIDRKDSEKKEEE
ncbi:cytochrome bd-I oxidase subunit CydX [Zophobihabitans entericus]|uniref:Cytochrome bd-I oxidase subunit CydX n=1 Tax=Zophobihabitans entericus TaxID=1635327 RepID=A0A6G9IBL3_9GAMM|nr:cytochrome bd-I oxidase subunit CydX [Zophobihabitans entericus]QIQ21625.1 cytochrome bd-I oxidase subunit CydX [Zophobihabitans entericus]